MNWLKQLVLAGVLPAMVWGCGHDSPVAPRATTLSTFSDAARKSLDAAQHVEGVLGPGAQYGIDVPAEWNGDLVLYMHGIKPAGDPVTLPLDFEDFDQILALLLDRGFAVAYSSYSENGYALAEGARQSHQLGQVFAEQFDKPRRTFLFGQSLGGIIGLLLAEKYPREYAGAFFVAAPIGGSRTQVDYLAHISVVFDVFYPNVLAGDLFHVPDTPFPQNEIIQAILADGGQGLGAMARIRQVQLQAGSEAELPPALLFALGLQWVGAEDFFDRTHEHVLFDNHQERYEALAPGLLPPDVIDHVNATVARYTSTADAERWLERYYEPSGQLGFPLLTVHTRYDPVIPLFHEAIYLEKVEAAGRGALLLQRTKDTFGHRLFTPAELVGAFDDLVEWVNSGAKPPA